MYSPSRFKTTTFCHVKHLHFPEPFQGKLDTVPPKELSLHCHAQPLHNTTGIPISEIIPSCLLILNPYSNLSCFPNVLQFFPLIFGYKNLLILLIQNSLHPSIPTHTFLFIHSIEEMWSLSKNIPHCRFAWCFFVP